MKGGMNGDLVYLGHFEILQQDVPQLCIDVFQKEAEAFGGDFQVVKGAWVTLMVDTVI